jgi:hypothetical protein
MAIDGTALSNHMTQLLLGVAWPLLQPVALAGVVLGHCIAGWLPPEPVRRVAFALLVFSAVATAGRGALSALARAC